jgi:mono/diheme cytochrome c family protein
LRQAESVIINVLSFGEGGSMGRIAAGIMILSICSAAPAAAQDAKARGEKVYADQKCSLCHSIGGKGNAKGPLDDVGSKLSPDEIRAWITDAKGMTAKTKSPRKPEMKAYTLPKEDVDGLVAYLSSLKKK